MRFCVRNCVFETNSSSTHSLTIKNTKKKNYYQVNKIKKIENRILELENNSNLSLEEKDELYKLKCKLNYTNSVAFTLKEPIEKLVWFLGIVDHAEGEKGKTIFEQEKHNLKTDRGIVRQFKDMLLCTYCEINNISIQQAYENIFDEAAKFTQYENILKNPDDIESGAKYFEEVDYRFKEFAKDYSDLSTVFKEFSKLQYLKDRSNCNKCTRFECDHYFSEGILSECTCGFEYYSDICYRLEKAKGKLTWQEFSKEFF